MVVDLLFALALRFFFFDFVLFKSFRAWLREKHYGWRKLFSCPFCQGFWCGVLVFLLANNLEGTWLFAKQLIFFSFSSAFLALTWTIWAFPLVKNYEKEQDLPLT
ncbi:MAG: hypothetical protein PHC60_07065 [Heliobacteriaceae bacterium]|nr:hypothetical protein [Heliobacteriaceae bacterium]MDD4588130.1 hypothetical protein [Heliobacteriaceae bacterium]